ncbi:hypothetical protein [Luteimonas salinilitoris]|uniref:Uncharacterized protein n=1 Tax=Luteimonas salinilitoris TaxID=3237697 RepID=A0ABV4HTZ0_9GAMM
MQFSALAREVHLTPLLSAWSALVEYAKGRPELFKSSVDYLSKGLGFVFAELRAKHKFSPETMKAFLKLEHLVEKNDVSNK